MHGYRNTMTENDFSYRHFFHLLYTRKQLFAFTAFLVMTITMITSYLLPKIYESSCTVFIEKKAISDLVQGIALAPNKQESAKVLTHALKSRTLIARVINEVDFSKKKMNDAAIETLVDRIEKDLTVMVNEKELFVITFRYKDARIARDFVNTLVRKYIEEAISVSREDSSGATQFLTEQLSLYKEKISENDSKVTDFKNTKAGVINLDEGRIYYDINAIEQSLNELLIKRKLLEEQRKASNPYQLKLVELKNRLKDLQVVYTENYPEVRNLKAQIETLQTEIAARNNFSGENGDNQDLVRIEAELKAVKEREAYLTRQLAVNKSLLNTVPSTKSTLKSLQDDVANQKNMFDLLKMRQQQSEVSKQVGVLDKGGTYRIIDPAVSSVYPVSPKRPRIMLMGIAAGIAAGIGLLMLLDSLDNSIRQIETLRRTGLPVMAVIPFIRGEDELTAIQNRDKLFYLLSACYFSFIVMILLLEVMKVPLLDRVFSKLTYLLLP